MSASLRSVDRVAEDRIVGEGTRSFAIARDGRVVRQIKPTDLSLFQLGILFNVIHHEAPNYSLLKYQSFWFVSTVLYIVESLWGNQLDKKEADHPTPNEYLPLQQLGTWRSMPIIAPNPELVERVISKFFIKQMEEFSLVIFFTNFDLFFY